MKYGWKMMVAGLVFSALSSTALAHGFTAGDLKIGHPWTRATAPGTDVAAGFLSVTNTGKQPDVLLGATAEGAKSVMIHQTSEKNGVMSMDAMDQGVTIAPGATVTLQPGGTHLMWMGVAKPLHEGDMISGTLTFKRAGTVPVGFKVEAMGAKVPMEHMHH